MVGPVRKNLSENLGVSNKARKGFLVALNAMTYGTEYVATAGPEQTAWLTDPEHFDGATAGVDNGDGTVTLSEEQVDVLRERDTGEGLPGDLEWDDEHGLLV